MAEREPKTHLNVGGPRGWTTACGIESSSFVDKHKTDEHYAVDCERCRKAMARMLSAKDADALVRVLSLAENSQIWTAPMVGEEMVKWREDTYAAIQTVRKFLKKRGVVTLHELTQRAAKAMKKEQAHDEIG